MHLPDLQLQIMYGRLAWGIVLAALLLSLWPRRFTLTRPVVAAITLGMIALQALPGAAAPAFSLALALHWPSSLLVGLCLAKLYACGKDAPAYVLMPTPLATVLALAGAVLYLDAFGLTALGLYYHGFGPYAAPALCLLLATGAALAIARHLYRPQAIAVLLATMSYAILRLPTGNLWDALLDPLLWGWALVALARGALHKRAPAQPA
jgi:hypothetical protein